MNIQMKKKKNAKDELNKEKLKLQLKARLLEKRLVDDFNYLQDNSREILISSAIHLLKPAKHKTNKQHQPTTYNEGQNKGVLSAINEYTPVVWEFLKPMALAWGVRSFKNMFTSFFTSKTKKKKKKKSRS